MSAQKSRTRVGIEIALAVLVLAAVFTWSESLLRDKVGPETSLFPTAEPGSEAATGLVRESELPVRVELFGTVQPARDATLSAQIMGTVTELTVDEGDRVERDQLLVRLSARELEATASAARREVDAAEARLEQARRDHARLRALETRQAATRIEREQAETGLELAEAALAAARQAASARRSIAAKTSLRAPFAGRVVERHVDPGDLALPGRPLLRLEAEEAWRLEVPVDEGIAAGLETGDAVSVSFDVRELAATARVGEIEPAADSASRTVLVKLDLPTGLMLRSGSFGRARFDVGSRRALLAPAAAIRRTGGLATARVLQGERLVTRHLRVGDTLESGEVEVLSGLSAGDRVALEGVPAS